MGVASGDEEGRSAGDEIDMIEIPDQYAEVMYKYSSTSTVPDAISEKVLSRRHLTPTESDG
jgi:hypothetical protein